MNRSAGPQCFTVRLRSRLLLACTNFSVCSAVGGSSLLPGHQVLYPRCGRQHRQRMAKSQACQMDCHQQLDCRKLCVASPDLWECDLAHAAECAKLIQDSIGRCATSYQACSRPYLKLQGAGVADARSMQTERCKYD